MPRNCLVIGLLFTLSANPDVFVSTDVPKPMNTSTLTLSSTLNVPDSLLVTDVNVSVNVAAFESSEHDIFLTSPAGTQVQLFNNNCGGGFDIVMTFDDEAGSGLGGCNAVNADNGVSFQPFNLLSAFDGEDSQGTWTLRVDIDSNIFAGETALRAWSLDLTATSTVVPEPASVVLTGTLLAGISWGLHRRRKRVSQV